MVIFSLLAQSGGVACAEVAVVIKTETRINANAMVKPVTIWPDVELMAFSIIWGCKNI